MNSRENFAGGAAISFDYNLPRFFALGLNFIASSNFSGIIVTEGVAITRRYFSGGYRGFFVQVDWGCYVILEDEEITFMFDGGLRCGFRFPLGTSFYIEPYGRIGYPFVFGVGAIAGLKY